MDIKLGVIGYGKMAHAIIQGVVNNEFIENNNIYIYDKNEVQHSFNKTGSIVDLLSKTNTILVATKPFVVDEVMTEVKKGYNNHLVMSILAGVKIQKYRSYINNINIARIMPNTPALVNMAASAVTGDKEAVEFAYKFMQNCGKVIKTTEDKMDAITALSGSGPAYYYKIIELMARSAQKLGLDYEDAILLSAQTALGSAKMVMENDYNIEQLIKNVTTPGGCTEVGNNVLNNSDIDKIIDKTINDTMQKAIDLG